MIDSYGSNPTIHAAWICGNSATVRASVGIMHDQVPTMHDQVQVNIAVGQGEFRAFPGASVTMFCSREELDEIIEVLNLARENLPTPFRCEFENCTQRDNAEAHPKGRTFHRRLPPFSVFPCQTFQTACSNEPEHDEDTE